MSLRHTLLFLGILAAVYLTAATSQLSGAEQDFIGTYLSDHMGCELQLRSDKGATLRVFVGSARLEQTFKGHWALEEKEIVFIGETWEGTFERRFKISSVFPPELAETDTLEVLPKDLGLLEIGEKPIAVTITTTYKLEKAEPNQRPEANAGKESVSPTTPWPGSRNRDRLKMAV